ncbi:MAG: hypothetical protein AUJ92_05130 [Armatimonadetes bacterium CG2_30_59_28]|nr:MAG: hypothetical protein AUJ92_05130 [Armatimonadetes bacterium CG2_30_59_28]PIU62209.1 MAG: hypothetical protein COS85_19095 [Armatimonadetes bacterium CG07_land_8_20_14_0_80_59_28]PIX40745.1 MAG: hypothetical protein COZ56_13900 [Armatimonadetes bacterium CG_4_8_14_3_um_filter_58_9]PJB67233.1 MAG: hypothetical protein CO095_12310 [Armatimonadetes bacterium CG_4_9_14_3_um_filter_58_7]
MPKTDKTESRVVIHHSSESEADRGIASLIFHIAVVLIIFSSRRGRSAVLSLIPISKLRIWDCGMTAVLSRDVATDSPSHTEADTFLPPP